MNTPLLRTTGLAVLALLCPARLATAQQDFSKVEIKTTAVAGNIHMLEGSGGNIGVSTDGKSLADVKAAGLPDKYKSWGGGFINASRWLEISYNSLSKKP